MKGLSFPSTQLFAFLSAFIIVCWDGIDLATAAVSDGMIEVGSVTDKGFIGRSVSVLVGNDNFYDNSVHDKAGPVKIVLSYIIRIVGSTPTITGCSDIIAQPTVVASLKTSPRILTYPHTFTLSAVVLPVFLMA